MALLDIFKKKKEEEAKKKIEKAVPKKEEQPVLKQKKSVKFSGFLSFDVLKEPYITEKATDLEKENKYIFKIFPEKNKIEVKKAIESLYKVKVVNVKIINIPRKKRRVGRRTEGWRKGYKKAIVRIKDGQKIEMLSR